MSLLRLLVVLTEGIGMHVAFTNPSQPPSGEEQVSSVSERILIVFIRKSALILKVRITVAAR
jgi:hypothetical protein